MWTASGALRMPASEIDAKFTTLNVGRHCTYIYFDDVTIYVYIGKNRRGKLTTPVTMACPKAGT